MANADQSSELHKQHFACFACRKAFKQPGLEEIGIEADRPFPCPQCQQPMTLMGRDFQAPSIRAVKEWHLLELLRSFGVVFEPGHTQPKTQPRTLHEAEAFLVPLGYDEIVIRKRLEKIRLARQEQKRPTRAEKKQREGRQSRR
jgi:hypothetical protein